ncbi:hypothetical protein [Pseudonocardia sp. ICBG1293]|uniref:hypothetical protein n=1 Tax=Pseudonocardia sp. ICBG1293 TaxID=2844382 RepID=UPI001CCC4B43|nr:hypothetical protein [Pseudonocardia sp. ICBG1293]
MTGLEVSKFADLRDLVIGVTSSSPGPPGAALFAGRVDLSRAVSTSVTLAGDEFTRRGDPV